MRRLACVTLFALVAAGPSTADALYPLVYKDHPLVYKDHPLVYKDHPLVYKALLPTQSVPKPNPIQSPNPPKENDLFRRFLEWLRTQPR